MNIIEKINRHLTNESLDINRIKWYVEKVLEPSINMIKREIKMNDSERVREELDSLIKTVNDIKKEIK